ncbi:MAG TPA: hypothetical protein VGP17_14560 [Solirubrobacteraceae bacterium]|nr:hypothetical protein [Solirubrobacteraceae bacterium]
MLGFKRQPLLGFGQGCFGGGDLCLHTLALVTESVGRYGVALLKMQPQEAALLSLEFGDQLGLG